MTKRAGQEGWRLLRATLAAQWKGIALGGVLGLLWSATKVAVPLLVGAAIDHAVDGEGSLLVWSCSIMLVGLLAGILSGARRYVAFREARWVETWLRERLFAHLQALHIGFHDEAQTGQLMSRSSNDLQQVQLFMVFIPLTLSNIALALGVAVVLFALNPLLALCALVPLPLVNLLAKRFSGRIYPALIDIQAESAEMATVVEESVSGVRVVKGFGAEPVQMARFSREAEDVRAASLRAAGVRRRYLPAIDQLPAVGLIMVLGVGGHMVVQGTMTIGELVAFNAYVALLVWPLRAIGMTVSFGQRASAALERVYEVLSTEPIVADPPHPLPLPPRVGGHHSGGIGFDGVRFGYDAGRPVLDGFDLTIEPGMSIAIVGATGAGKSTVARLLARFYDVDDGAIRLDGIDLRRLRVHDLRRAVGIVFEDTFLFHDTVSANIAFADPDASPARIERAAALAGATEFIDDLPDGYATLLGERGFSLSGGQRQRIAIARAILADPRVLVLDDATSAVDPSKEHEIRDALSTVMTGRTTIVIAHRPATISLADRVVLLDGGRVAAEGTHRQLLDTSERYGEVLAAWAARDAEQLEVA
ncbi:MAG TPA: ABC transporter ATP-binding protein [Acidimicrobiales bacterium]|nr:ABC transporter ATP-binding protein [Acidimicrobiales bacterium]